MATEVMNRVEKKFVLDADAFARLHSIVSDHAAPDPYSRGEAFYTISNLYLDTPDSRLIRTSLEKPRYKEKLRLRAYGVPADTDFVFLEIKKKYGGVVNKRRIRLLLPEAYAFIATGEKPGLRPYMNPQVLNELAYCFQIYDLSPRLYLAYDRKAYLADGGLRITFDTNIRTRRHDLRLEKGDYGTPLTEAGQWLLEVKTEGAMPLWLTRALSGLQLYGGSFSKYGAEYQQFLKGRQEICFHPYLTQLSKARA